LGLKGCVGWGEVIMRPGVVRLVGSIVVRGNGEGGGWNVGRGKGWRVGWVGWVELWLVLGLMDLRLVLGLMDLGEQG
jgi:hypothetical protein